jgi:hypothetical protein
MNHRRLLVRAQNTRVLETETIRSVKWQNPMAESDDQEGVAFSAVSGNSVAAEANPQRANLDGGRGNLTGRSAFDLMSSLPPFP